MSSDKLNQFFEDNQEQAWFDVPFSMPCSKCYRSDTMRCRKLEQKDQIEVVCSDCQVTQKFFMAGLWEKLV